VLYSNAIFIGLRFEVEHASCGLSAVTELLVLYYVHDFIINK